MYSLNIIKTVLFASVVVLCFHYCGRPGECKRVANSVVVSMEGNPDHLNPILTKTQYGQMPVSLAYMSLMAYSENELQPWLIKKVPQKVDLPNGTIAYTFEILEEATWDNGDPVTGYDYLFTLKTILNPKIETVLRSFVETIKSVKIDSSNPKRFTVEMSPKTIHSLEYAANSFSLLPAYLKD